MMENNRVMNNVKVGDLTIGKGQKLTLLGGPCTAESEALCLEVAEYLSTLCKELDIQYIFKASFDKANRSSGSSRRGPGMKAGLGYLAAVKEKFNIPVVTDIHESTDAAPVAEVADLLQIPAFLCRQTDLLVAAGKTMKPVNIKKGQFLAPEDMKGAVEKFRSTGNDQVMLCERGTTFGYHNLVVDMRSLQIMRNMGVPVVFDATHSVQLPGGLGNASGGQREFVLPLARAAAAIGIDALFTEVHPRPEQAWSDGPNSLDFRQIRETLVQVKALHDLIG
ncbi:MAG: 3-deoxy-8-phosphooctulonate synthase [Lentisphaerae bacterium]|nr:3-deoxy-8-phosphooctulonate synthase [Lentisphaerota bacterium]